MKLKEYSKKDLKKLYLFKDCEPSKKIELLTSLRNMALTGFTVFSVLYILSIAEIKYALSFLPLVLVTIVCIEAENKFKG